MKYLVSRLERAVDLQDEDNEEEGMEGEYDDEDGDEDEDEDEDGDGHEEDFGGREDIRGQLDPDDVVFVRPPTTQSPACAVSQHHVMAKEVSSCTLQ